MPTYAQLESERWWGREIVTAELDWLGDVLCSRLRRPRAAAGSKGDNEHLNGAHRSQEWILNSRWATSRTYTVQSGLNATQLRHISGFDMVPGEWGSAQNRRLMIEQTGRLLAAMRGRPARRGAAALRHHQRLDRDRLEQRHQQLRQLGLQPPRHTGTCRWTAATAPTAG